MPGGGSTCAERVAGSIVVTNRWKSAAKIEITWRIASLEVFEVPVMQIERGPMDVGALGHLANGDISEGAILGQIKQRLFEQLTGAKRSRVI